MDVVRVDDPISHAVHGRVLDPTLRTLGRLERWTADIRVSADEGWAIATDRVGAVRLVQLATGRSWPLDRDRTLVWWPAG
jgi:hypothetical protein